MSRAFRLLVVVMVVTLLGEMFLIASLAVVPAVVRAMPGRYAYYLPEPLQALRRVAHAATVPTPAPVAGGQEAPLAAAAPLPGEAEMAATVEAARALAASRPASCSVEGLRYEAQKWNNCGPATLAMALSHWGRAETQDQTAPALKPDPDDKNVGPDEMVSYARGLGMEAIARPGGDLELLKRLLSAGFPVIVETWHVPAPDDQMGHYLLVIGYDDVAGQFTTYDSLQGSDLPIGYQELDELWRAFNRLYLVVYPLDRAEEIAEALGPRMDETAALQGALAVAQEEALRPPPSCVAYADCEDGEAFAWFNMGSSLVGLGRHQEAAAAFDRARTLGLPWRMLWYQFGPYEAYHAVGRHQEVIALADSTLKVADKLEESHLWRGKARLALGDPAGARADFEAALGAHSGWGPALAALAELEGS